MEEDGVFMVVGGLLAIAVAIMLVVVRSIGVDAGIRLGGTMALILVVLSALLALIVFS